MRLRHNSKAIALLEESHLVIKSFPFIPKKETVIEIGMGKGQMLTTLASQNQKWFYIGIEKNATVVAKALKRSQKLKLSNFLVINADVAKLEALLAGPVQIIWLTFSDPWPKKRHAKRRLTSPNFLASYQKILAKNGKIKLKTDDFDFFTYSIRSFQESGWQLQNITYDLTNSPLAKTNIKTEYEEKWIQKLKKINYLEAKR